MHIKENSRSVFGSLTMEGCSRTARQNRLESCRNEDSRSSSFRPDVLADIFAGSVPVTGMFAHAVNMESLVRYPMGNAVYLKRGDATVETCQAGVSSNLLGTLALAGAGILSGVGLAAAALPVAGLGLSALLFSGATNAFTRQELASDPERESFYSR